MTGNKENRKKQILSVKPVLFSKEQLLRNISYPAESSRKGDRTWMHRPEVYSENAAQAAKWQSTASTRYGIMSQMKI